MVFCIRVETTSPITSLRRCLRCPLACGFGHYFFSVAGAANCARARWSSPAQCLAQAANLLQALGLSHVQLEFSLKSWSCQLALLVAQLVVGQVSNFFCFHKSVLSSQLSALARAPGSSEAELQLSQCARTSRSTNVVRSASLCDARRMASVASCTDTPSISNRILPGFTTATQ